MVAKPERTKVDRPANLRRSKRPSDEIDPVFQRRRADLKIKLLYGGLGARAVTQPD